MMGRFGYEFWYVGGVVDFCGGVCYVDCGVCLVDDVWLVVLFGVVGGVVW